MTKIIQASFPGLASSSALLPESKNHIGGVYDAIGATSARDLFAWTRDGIGAHPQRVLFARKLLTDHPIMRLPTLLPRVLVGPMLGIFLLLDKIAFGSLLATVVKPSVGFSLSQFSTEKVGNALPAGMTRPDMLALLPNEIVEQIFRTHHELTRGLWRDRFRDDGLAEKDGLNPLHLTQLAGASRQLHDVLGQNIFWHYWVGTELTPRKPHSTYLKQRFDREIRLLNEDDRRLVKYLYSPSCYKIEQFDRRLGAKTPRIVAAAAVATDAQAWWSLTPRLKQDLGLMRLYTSNQTNGMPLYRDQPKREGFTHAKKAVDFLKTLKCVKAWQNMSQDEKKNLTHIESVWSLQSIAHARFVGSLADGIFSDPRAAKKVLHAYPLLGFFPKAFSSGQFLSDFLEGEYPEVLTHIQNVEDRRRLIWARR